MKARKEVKAMKEEAQQGKDDAAPEETEEKPAEDAGKEEIDIGKMWGLGRQCKWDLNGWTLVPVYQSNRNLPTLWPRIIFVRYLVRIITRTYIYSAAVGSASI